MSRKIGERFKELETIENALTSIQNNLSEITDSSNKTDEEANIKSTKIPVGFELSHKFLGHQDFISRIAWSPNGQLLASPSIDGTICVWDKETKKLYKRFKETSISAFSVAWSPDSKSLAAASDDCFIRVWNVTDGVLYQEIEGCTDVAFDIAWSPDGKTLALGLRNGTIQLWDVGDWRLKMSFYESNQAVWVVSWHPNGSMIASGSAEGIISLWDVNGKLLQQFRGHSHSISSLSWSGDGQRLASAGSHDLTIRIWDLKTGRATNLLEGHTKAISCVSFSYDSRFLASKSEDNTVQLWSCKNWKKIATLDEPMDSNMLRNIAFHPKEPLLATVNRRDHAIQIWHLDESLLEAQINAKSQEISSVESENATIHHTSAKIVLVGESNVGKSCLALRLAEDRYEEQGTTHGMRLWTIPPEKLSPEAIAPEEEKRDVVLWDMGGQDEYRLVHQLFLHDTTLALVLLDPTRGRSAFEEAEAWSKRLEKQLQGRKAIKLLVGTKLDEDSSAIDRAGLARLVQNCNFAGYFPTSANNKRGINELRIAISQTLDWNSIAKTSRPELFQTIRDEIEKRRKDGQVILFYTELEDHIYQDKNHRFADLVEAVAVNDVVNQLALQGVITDTKLVNGERALVLKIDEVERYAGSIIIAARDNLRGIPAIEEQLVASTKMTFPGIRQQERLKRIEELIVLECVVQLLIQYGICLQHEGLLVFPTLFQPTEKEDLETIPHAISLYYDFSGAIDNIYSSLVAKLAISKGFGRMRLWVDRAEFKLTDRGVCGLRKVERHSGLAHLDVFFDQETFEDTRNLFIAFIEGHLQKQGVEVCEHVEITCACGYRFTENSIRKRVADGNNDIGCPECDQRTKISEGARQVREQDLNLEDRLWALRTTIEEKEKSIIEGAKIFFELPNNNEEASTPLRVLHLSDLHLSANADPQSMLQPLIADIRDPYGGLGFEKLDYLVVSGDLTNFATPEEFEQARQFISGLIEQFHLSAERCIIVPGNHDLSWNEEVYIWKQKRLVKVNDLRQGSYLEQEKGFLVKDEERYPQRFKNFSEIFYHPLVMKEYPLKAEEQCIPYLFVDTGIQFLAMNSCWEIDELFPNRSSICDAALARGIIAADKQIDQAKQGNQLSSDGKILRIAVWHHPVTGNEKMQQDDFLDRLRQANYKLCLHGHIHEERTDVIGYLHPTRSIHVAGTGSFGAPTHARPESTPRLYNLLEIERDHSKIKVHTRCLRKNGGAWEGWAVWSGQKRTERRTYYEIQLGRIARGQKAGNKASAAKKKGNLADKKQEVKGVNNSLIDFVIITAIKIERLAVLKVFEIDESRDRIRRGSRTYWRKRLLFKDGNFYEIIVAQSLDMANVNAAILTNDTLHHWQPAAVLMIGIAATAKPEPKQHLGDLVIGKEVYYYETGKITAAGTLPEPKQIPVDTTLLDRVQALPDSDFSILVDRPDGTNTRPKIDTGVIASGDKVIADAVERDAITSANRKILAIEMEGYGVIEAARQSFDQVRCLVIRALCDYADSSKNDQWHAYAAAVAAGFTKHFLLDEPLDPRNHPRDTLN